MMIVAMMVWMGAARRIGSTMFPDTYLKTIMNLPLVTLLYLTSVCVGHPAEKTVCATLRIKLFMLLLLQF